LRLLNVGPNVFDSSGYGETNRAILLELYKMSVRIKIKPFSSHNQSIRYFQDVEQVLTEMVTDSLDWEAPILFTCPAPMFQPQPDHYNLGLTMLECDRIDKEWMDKCNQMDEVWVPSLFNYQIFIQCGVDPARIRVIPLGTDPNRFHPQVPPMAIPQARKKFTFLAIFEFIFRKGCDLLLQAYFEEFSERDSVCLILKTFENGGRYDPDGKKVQWFIRNLKLKMGLKPDQGPHLIILSKVLPAYQMPSLYTAADCYITASRGEGWDLPAVEAMASGLPVIATNWSAHQEYMNHNNSLLVEVEKLEPIPNYWLKEALMAVPSIKNMRLRMRYAYKNPELVKRVGVRARTDIAGHYTWRNTAIQIYERLQLYQGLRH
jgi:glycosyltransferase involved in cell wall biosynthesis